jgi:hypothetical protein
LTVPTLARNDAAIENCRSFLCAKCSTQVRHFLIRVIQRLYARCHCCRANNQLILKSGENSLICSPRAPPSQSRIKDIEAGPARCALRNQRYSLKLNTVDRCCALTCEDGDSLIDSAPLDAFHWGYSRPMAASCSKNGAQGVHLLYNFITINDLFWV